MSIIKFANKVYNYKLTFNFDMNCQYHFLSNNKFKILGQQILTIEGLLEASLVLI